MANKRVHI